jgi:hypothetical protein
MSSAARTPEQQNTLKSIVTIKKIIEQTENRMAEIDRRRGNKSQPNNDERYVNALGDLERAEKLLTQVTQRLKNSIKTRTGGNYNRTHRKRNHKRKCTRRK